jgi:hypothetical protein
MAGKPTGKPIDSQEATSRKRGLEVSVPRCSPTELGGISKTSGRLRRMFFLRGACLRQSDV